MWISCQKIRDPVNWDIIKIDCCQENECANGKLYGLIAVKK